MMDLITSILAITLRAGTSLVYATIGETYTERAGILNLGLEGIMLMGAVTSFAVVYYTGSLALALLTAVAVGGLLSLVHAFLTVTMRANQVVSGLSITLFGTGFASFLGQRLGPVSNGRYLVGLTGPRFSPLDAGALGRIPVLGAFLNQDLLTYGIYILIPLAWFYLYRTRNGLWLRAVGENPRTADAMGVPVFRAKYLLHDPGRYADGSWRSPPLPGLYPRLVREHHGRPRLDRHSPGDLLHVEPGPGHHRRPDLRRHQRRPVPTPGFRDEHPGGFP